MAIRHAIADIRLMNSLFSAAEREALALGDEQPSAEHMLLAALDLPDDSARQALGRSADDYRAAITAVHDAALAGVGIAAGPGAVPAARPAPASKVYRSSGAAQELFQRARMLVGGGQLRSAHILLAALEVEHGTVARALDRLGIDRQAVATAARALVASNEN